MAVRLLSNTSFFYRELLATATITPKNHLKINSQQPLSSSSMDSEGLNLVKKVYELVIKEKLLSGHYDKSKNVVEFVPPVELGNRLGGLEIPQDGIENVDELLESVVKYSVKTCHSHFYNQLYHGSDPAGLAGQVNGTLRSNSHKMFCNRDLS